MSSHETRPGASLLDMPAVRTEDGSSLSMVGYMRRDEELQALSALFDLHHHILLALFWSYRILALERDYERGTF